MKDVPSRRRLSPLSWLWLPICLALGFGQVAAAAATSPTRIGWEMAWPRTDFTTRSVPLEEIVSGGPGKDGIPAIDRPAFKPAREVAGLAETEPVISVEGTAGEMRAYPLRILIWHEIVNDELDGVPIAVTYCPLCNSAVVFDRRVHGSTYSFGTTGNLRHSDLVMYDRETESWWQQFTGEAIVGAMTGALLEPLPSRVESFAAFKARAGSDALVLVPNDDSLRAYGRNPYVRYDSEARPFLYQGPLPEGIPPLARVVVVDGEAWSLEALRNATRIEAGNLVLSWTPGQNSALDASAIGEGRDIGNVAVQRHTEHGLVDEVHDVSFAFAFKAFHPNGVIHASPPQ